MTYDWVMHGIVWQELVLDGMWSILMWKEYSYTYII